MNKIYPQPKHKTRVIMTGLTGPLITPSGKKKTMHLLYTSIKK